MYLNLVKIHNKVVQICLLIFIFSTAVISVTYAQNNKTKQTIDRPKLVVGIVVDQMRWDYLYRYYDRYSEGGFKRLMREGFNCENTHINHLPSATAVGHATIYTGSVPSIHGIAGNEWIDQLSGKAWYCTEDTLVQAVGSTSKADKMSPRNLLTTTITDELRLAENFRSRVIGVSVKDRAAIIPAGHNPTGAFWLDDVSGNFITSTWYMDKLPEWVISFNNQKVGQKLVANGWNTLYPIDSYIQSSKDDVPWEGKFGSEKAPVFPHEIAANYNRKPGVIRGTPFGNTLTLNFARSAIEAYQLGRGLNTDFLTINCASTDYVGHMFGVNSIEVEDTYLRLDKDLEELFNFLDKQTGKGNYLVFLTADHGAAHAEGFMKEHNFPTGYWDTGLLKELNVLLQKKFGIDKLVREDGNIGASYQINFDKKNIEQHDLDFDNIKKLTVEYLQKQPGIMYAADMSRIQESPIPDEIKTAMINGYNIKRSGSVQIIPNPGWMPEYSQKGTTHGAWNPYDTHIPLLFMGKGVIPGSTNKVTYMTDIAPTLAALLKIQMPNGCIGKPIYDVIKVK